MGKQEWFFLGMWFGIALMVIVRIVVDELIDRGYL